ncbi:hypothetical protein ASG47_19620 [Devosia sp. Leaf420]|nr:hypothetical protein ASG47_19620 [Devosia sp. Leaf420]
MRSRPYRLRGKPRPTSASKRPADRLDADAGDDQVFGAKTAGGHVPDGVGARTTIDQAEAVHDGTASGAGP